MSFKAIFTPFSISRVGFVVSLSIVLIKPSALVMPFHQITNKPFCPIDVSSGAFSKMNHLANAAKDATAGSDAQLFVFFIMVVAAAEVSVGLAIIVMLYRNTHSVDVNFLNRLKH